MLKKCTLGLLFCVVFMFINIFVYSSWQIGLLRWQLTLRILLWLNGFWNARFKEQKDVYRQGIKVKKLNILNHKRCIYFGSFSFCKHMWNECSRWSILDLQLQNHVFLTFLRFIYRLCSTLAKWNKS
jgi:hypothetical protein